VHDLLPIAMALTFYQSLYQSLKFENNIDSQHLQANKIYKNNLVLAGQLQ